MKWSAIGGGGRGVGSIECNHETSIRDGTKSIFRRLVLKATQHVLSFNLSFDITLASRRSTFV
jgi:hypothetical protein